MRFLVNFRSVARIKDLEITALSSFSIFASKMNSKITNNRKCQTISAIVCVFLHPQKLLEVYRMFWEVKIFSLDDSRTAAWGLLETDRMYIYI